MPAKLEEIGLLRPDTVQCPYPYYKRTRETAPVHFMPDPNTLLVSSYDLCREVLKDAKAYANKIGVASPNRREKAEAIIAEKGYGRFLPTIVNNDPPAHGYFRKLFDRAFRASCIRRMVQYIDEIVGDLIDAFADRGAREAVADFTVPMPMYIVRRQISMDA